MFIPFDGVGPVEGLFVCNGVKMRTGAENIKGEKRLMD